jgi:hypothetical protein
MCEHPAAWNVAGCTVGERVDFWKIRGGDGGSA